MTTLRNEFESNFGSNSALRRLAENIAAFSDADMLENGFDTASQRPVNLLSNGQSQPFWTLPPCPPTIDALIGWKQSGKGVSTSSTRGLSLLFDPFVDATLLAQMRNGGLRDTTAFVLTDYNPMLNIVEEMSELICQDWAEQATRDFLSAKNLGLTGCNIVKAICGGKDSIPTIQGSKPDRLQNALQTSRLVIWNYFPFARGGNQTEGKGGLPDMKDCRWISQCDKWLLSFLAAVNATTVIFAMNGFVKDARRNCHETQVNQHGLYEINDICHPRPWHTRKCACHRNRFLDEIKMA